ncbi:MAG: hypothetical protein NE330_16505 [Lentisphaeraceae bacterium]|nr:hypothetical protein [Lentisphaeraceae bacterium]
MTTIIKLSVLILFFLTSLVVAKDSPEEKAKNEAIRAAIPMGGALKPKAEEGIFMAAGHGMNILVSRDDGKTWQQSFKGRPGGDHGYWAVWNNIAYTNGVFAVAAGWGAPGTIIATDDGVNWQHLTTGKTSMSRKGGKPYDMKTTMQLVGAEGSFVMPLASTADFGKNWKIKSAYGWKDKAGNKIKIDIGHPSIAFGDGRILVIGDKGPGIFSDDLGKSWEHMNVKIDPWAKRGSKGLVYHNGAFLLLRTGEHILRSTDKGMTWMSHKLGIERPSSRSFCLSIAGDEVWATGKTSMKSKDGLTWEKVSVKDLNGQVARSDKGTLINVSRKRLSILRSTDDGKTWSEVYKYTSEGKGGAQGLADVVFGKVNKQ